MEETEYISFESTRHNIKLSTFFSYIEKQLKKRGIDFAIDKNYFIDPPNPTSRTYRIDKDFEKHILEVSLKDGKKVYYNHIEKIKEIIPNIVAETNTGFPLEYQTYILFNDNTEFNEILEFYPDAGFENEKKFSKLKGTGYYFYKEKKKG
jgi:hypothetical protein